jgi:hypothetical protein
LSHCAWKPAKRAVMVWKSSEVLLGDASYHRELMMQNWAA